ncbi:MAG: hypothetical protein HDT21_03710 [Ruminococcus sp.]|nr:hypothetical protein [Ruminococcus sp.]
MKIFMKILGILLIIINSIGLLWGLNILGMAASYGTNVSPATLMIYFIPLIIGIILVVKSNGRKDNNKHIKFNQNQQIYSEAQGKPISEYLMDDRTKLVTYYDRMPQDYKSQLVNYADKLYRNYENQEYLNRK